MATLLAPPVAAETSDRSGLTPKQCEVLELVLHHKSNKEIARILGISPSAVDQRLSGARLRLGTQRRSDTAMAYAHLKATCVKSTAEDTQVAFMPFVGNDKKEAEGERLLLLEDVGVTGDFPFWPDVQSAPTGFRAFSVPANPWVRLALIVVFALLIAVIALIGMSVTQGVVALLRH